MMKKKLVAKLAVNDRADSPGRAATVVKARRRKPKANGKSLVASEAAQGMEYQSKAIGRALEVMDFFQDAETTLSLTELSSLSGFPESSTSRGKLRAPSSRPPPIMDINAKPTPK